MQAVSIGRMSNSSRLAGCVAPRSVRSLLSMARVVLGLTRRPKPRNRGNQFRLEQLPRSACPALRTLLGGEADVSDCAAHLRLWLITDIGYCSAHVGFRPKWTSNPPT